MALSSHARIVNEDKLLACIHCGFCLSACPTYSELGSEADSPRGRIYFMRALLEGRIEPSAPVKEHLARCLACFSCETSCPSSVRYRELIEDARSWLAANSPAPAPFLWRPFFLHVLPRARLLRLALSPLWLAQALGVKNALANLIARLPLGWPSRAIRFLPDRVPSPVQKRPSGVFPAEGERVMRVGFMLGCVMEGSLPDLNRLMIAILCKTGCEVLVPPGQGCCGALAQNAGESGHARKLARRLISSFSGARVDAIVANAAGCGAAMKEYPRLVPGTEAEEFARKVRDFTEVMTVLTAKNPPSNQVPLKAAYQEACHLRHAQGILSQPRDLLKAVPGLSLTELPEQDLCCGSAGVYNILQSGIGDALGRRKAALIAASGASAAVTANPGCLLQLNHACKEGGISVRLLHLAQVLGAAYGVGPKL